MIENVMTIREMRASDILPFNIIQIWDAELSTTRLVMCKGHTATWSVFAYDNGYTFRLLGSDTLSVVTDMVEWDGMSEDIRTDIELGLMVRGI
jgi:hypothetical protein